MPTGMSDLSRKHAVVLSFGLGIASTIASNFILTRVSTRELSQSAHERSRKRTEDNAGDEHQKDRSRSRSSESTIRQHEGLDISCTCLPVGSEKINFQEVKEIISAFEEAGETDCNGSQRRVYRNMIIGRFRSGIEKLSCETLQEIYESIIEKTCQKNGARISKSQ
ncbi:uncharacterized protein EAF01_011104 [Botrytis porri]|uniref:Uncharacterized protein n=1 Tax=Botrytis porri TaxID=87229 RepID=A0A4Z1KH92_9HELO|nr:uncharacterized protein EAF01_011104 [Botrytis porri]KAF7887950.1 hypothetical protein EAF01_011104 [Botrytis porri]TGO84898.1 hypothetical protein BPOR_0453g00080 [Botrytis porri]